MSTTRGDVGEGSSEISLLPYSGIVGQQDLKLALELAYIAPRIGGVLISGERGTGKSTAVRAFARMAYDGQLPVTLPINATEDRVVGGWRIDALMQQKAERHPGLLEAAHNKLLYVDEINLLDDHIVNIILDVTSTGILTVQREGLDQPEKRLSFTLVGTMNPEEGWLRPQLRDRFGLMVRVQAEQDLQMRRQILDTVFQFDRAVQEGPASGFFVRGQKQDKKRLKQLQAARRRLADVRIPDQVAHAAVKLAEAFETAGHRGEFVITLASQAYAALDPKAQEVSLQHVSRIVPLALQHRRPEAAQGDRALWSEEDVQRTTEILAEIAR